LLLAAAQTAGFTIPMAPAVMLRIKLVSSHASVYPLTSALTEKL
jgi:hypothetical protein